jgi:hypothetical protein
MCQAAFFGLGSQAAILGDGLIHCRSAPQHPVFGRTTTDIASKIGRIRLRYKNRDQALVVWLFLPDRHYQVDVNIYM